MERARNAEAANAPHERSTPSFPWAFGLSCALLALAIVAAFNEAFLFLAKRRAFSAQAAARRGDDSVTLPIAQRALRFDAHNAQALYIRAVRLKATGRAEELKETLPRLLEVHPNQASVWRLAGEMEYRAKNHGAAADALWRALWISPIPPASPANFWRMALAASAQAGRPGDAMAAALRASELAENDSFLAPADRRGLYADAATELQRQGLPLAARHFESLGR